MIQQFFIAGKQQKKWSGMSSIFLNDSPLHFSRKRKVLSKGKGILPQAGGLSLADIPSPHQSAAHTIRSKADTYPETLCKASSIRSWM
jgi:hypothetical protein